MMKNKRKKCEAIILPTKRHKDAIVSRENILITYSSNHHFKNDRKWHTSKYYNLYIISDDEIKEGDWCYCTKTSRIKKCNSIVNKPEHPWHGLIEVEDCEIGCMNPKFTRKIIATFEGNFNEFTILFETKE